VIRPRGIGPTVTVDVTREDILEGVCADPTRCAIAIALCRALSIDRCAYVVEGAVSVLGEELDLPVEASAWLRRYDSGPECPACEQGRETFGAAACRTCRGSGLQIPADIQPLRFDLELTHASASALERYRGDLEQRKAAS